MNRILRLNDYRANFYKCCDTGRPIFDIRGRAATFGDAETAMILRQLKVLIPDETLYALPVTKVFVRQKFLKELDDAEISQS